MELKNSPGTGEDVSFTPCRNRPQCAEPTLADLGIYPTYTVAGCCHPDCSTRVKVYQIVSSVGIGSKERVVAVDVRKPKG
jgi:hypothetical protein